MSHINTVDYAGWHLPCYAIHNCPQRLLSKGNAGYAAESDDDVLVHQGTMQSRFDLRAGCMRNIVKN